MSTLASPRFYVYVLARPSGEPFYVGKGKGPRVFAHEWEAKRGCDCRKCRTIRKIWKVGGEVARYIMLETDNEQDALDYERELIAMYGRNTLANHTDGGEGVTGYTPTPEHRLRLSLLAQKRQFSAETRAKMSASASRPEVNAIRAAAMRRPEVRAKLAAIASNPSAETRARMSAAQTRRAADPAERARLIERSRSAIAVTAKRWICTAPDGTVYHVVNLHGFCREHGLTGSTMARVAKGHHHQHKGWTCRHDDEAL
jgi:hypothetical protein